MTDETSRARRGMNDETPPDGDPYTAYDEFDLPAYVGLPSFQKLPWITDAAALAAAKPDVAIVGAPFDDAVSHRPGARFGPRAIRQARRGAPVSWSPGRAAKTPSRVRIQPARTSRT